jgi:nucleoporin SEH1
VERARLVDSRGSVQDIEFGPKHLGLKLASTSTDGQVRIYEALDVMNVSHWTLMEEFQICPTSREVDGQFCLSWCPNRFLPPMLVVGCGKEFTARIYRYDENSRKWTILIESLGIHGNFVYDVAWAPNMGRSYELVATANKDSHVRIFKISGVTSSGSAVGANAAPKQPLFKSLLSGVGSSNQANAEASQTLPNSSGSLAPVVELIGDFKDHQAEVWRVSWNMTGNILSSSGDDGHVRLWKTDPFGIWRQMSILPA